MLNKLEICKKTRKFAARSLYTVLKKLLESQKPISEVTLRDAWLAEMRKNKNIFSEGWYSPPPYGMAVIIGGNGKDSRRNYKSLRPAENWPKDNVFLDKRSQHLYAYASPVDRKTGIIGDFAISLYFGDDLETKHFLKMCFMLDK